MRYSQRYVKRKNQLFSTWRKNACGNGRLRYHVPMKTWSDLIRAWGGPHKFAKSIGVSDASARMMSHRNNVQSDYWPIIVARAPQAGLDGITYEVLTALKRGKQAKGQKKMMTA